MHLWTNQTGTYSQGSQDLYLQKIFQVISHTNKYFVEFGFNEPGYSKNRTGANSQMLYEKGWRGLLLDNHYENNMINLKKHYLFANNIASIFAENNVPKQPDFISCDMDSHDLWIMRSILQAGYRPRIFTTEFNSNYHITDALTLLDPTVNCSDAVPNNFTFVFQQCAWGASAGALRIVAESHGYTMIGRIGGLDLIWMRNDLKMKNQQLNDQIQEDEEEKMSDSEKSDEDDDNNVFDAQQLTVKVNHLIILESEIPFEAKRLINLIVAAKQLVKYAKLININQTLEDKSSPRLVQCTIVRWLSMSDCLEALLKSLQPFCEIFDERHMNKEHLEKINVILLEKNH
ncbi:unnamed protein product [Rotaria sp. Silwood2]|nr:unnamed protein product [Rotaria sp. Silwood2]